MASVVYTRAKHQILNGTIDMDADDIRCALLMNNTTADTEEDTTTLSGFTTLGEADDASYTGQKTSGRHVFTSEAVNEDTTNDRSEFDGEDITWTALANSTNPLQGALIYKHVTNDTDSIPIAFIEFSSNQSPGGSDFTISWNAEGILQLT